MQVLTIALLRKEAIRAGSSDTCAEEELHKSWYLTVRAPARHPLSQPEPRAAPADVRVWPMRPTGARERARVRATEEAGSRIVAEARSRAELARLWVHESQRTFADRMMTEEDEAAWRLEEQAGRDAVTVKAFALFGLLPAMDDQQLEVLALHTLTVLCCAAAGPPHPHSIIQVLVRYNTRLHPLTVLSCAGAGEA